MVDTEQADMLAVFLIRTLVCSSHCPIDVLAVVLITVTISSSSSKPSSSLSSSSSELELSDDEDSKCKNSRIVIVLQPSMLICVSVYRTRLLTKIEQITNYLVHIMYIRQTLT